MECTGDPIRLTAILTETGAASFPGVAQDHRDGINAATTAINSACQLGRPLQVDVCDDKSDPNVSTTCGQEAKDNGSLAIVLGIGLSENGVTTSGLPIVLTEGAGFTELSSPNSYQATAPLLQLFGAVSAAKSLGAEDFLLVVADVPEAQFITAEAKKSADRLGIAIDSILYPPGTTDWAPIAAQVSARHPQSMAIVAPGVVPLMSAFADEGLLAKDIPMFLGGLLVPPEVVEQLGANADGMYMLAQAYPAQATDNQGVQQMLREYEAAGIDTDPSRIGTQAVEDWAKLHVLADAIAALDPGAIETLDSAALTDALVALGPVARPELTPFDFTKNPFPDNPVLSAFRVFSRDVLISKIEDGVYVPVTDFSDIDEVAIQD